MLTNAAAVRSYSISIEMLRFAALGDSDRLTKVDDGNLCTMYVEVYVSYPSFCFNFFNDRLLVNCQMLTKLYTEVDALQCTT